MLLFSPSSLHKKNNFKILCLSLFAVLVFASPIASAQDIVPETAQDIVPNAAIDETVIDGSGEAAPPVTDPLPEPELPKKKVFTDAPQVRLRILDKVRAESRTYDLEVGHTVAYANIRIRPRACRKSSPLDDPENASFLQIWEVLPSGKSAWIFSGWMFSSSPSLSAMDHPVYDVTVLDCLDPNAKAITPKDPEAETKKDEAAQAQSPTDAAIDAYISEGPTNDMPSAESAPESNN